MPFIEEMSPSLTISRFVVSTVDNMPKIFCLVTLPFFISLCIGYAAAVPLCALERIYPELIPGPGLPSLASLGFTSAQLYQSKEEHGQNPFNYPGLTSEVPPPKDNLFSQSCRRLSPFCGGGDGDTANVEDVIACFS